MAHDVFISYSSKNKTTADAICHVLEAHEIKCWIAPRDINPGVEYGDIIPPVIKSSKICITVFSEYANLSRWVKNEVRIAFENNNIILPIKIDNTLPNGQMEIFLNGQHWIDAYPNPQDKFADLLIAIKKLLQVSANDEKSNFQKIKENTAYYSQPLDYLVRINSIDGVKAVLSSFNVNPNSLEYVSIDGDSPLHIAVSQDNIEIVSLLLSHSANSNAKNKRGMTPLMKTRTPEIIKMLIKYGANVNMKDNDGDTALHHAVFFIGDEKVINLLIVSGADLNAKNYKSKTPLGITTFLQIKTRELLIQKGAKI